MSVIEIYTQAVELYLRAYYEELITSSESNFIAEELVERVSQASTTQNWEIGLNVHGGCSRDVTQGISKGPMGRLFSAGVNLQV